ncbi:MAG: cyclic nucleotide-binding domain-containing protein [Muribaculaceae bacterium]|nr:cyclic nucleotide-binding domain-containing protein [Muribaculaceae bacterium]
MPSMYETIMELPLFKGIGEEQLSMMLEKTSMEFLKFEDGHIIARPEENVRAVDFILSGRVRKTYTLENFKISVDEILGKGSVLGALNLFGMETRYCASCVALGNVSLLRIEKNQYMNILQADKIYMLNFVNYLSAAAQRFPSKALKQKDPSIFRTLENLVNSFVSRSAETVILSAEPDELAKFCGTSPEKFNEWKSNALAHHYIAENHRGIILKSHHKES